jgi:hypothetical protein
MCHLKTGATSVDFESWLAECIPPCVPVTQSAACVRHSQTTIPQCPDVKGREDNCTGVERLAGSL